MLHLKNFWPLLFIVLCFNGFLSCKSGGDRERAATDSLGNDSSLAAGADSASMDSVRFSFQSVLDSVYQRTPKNVLAALQNGHSRFAGDRAFVHRSSESIPDSLARKRPYLIVTDIDLQQSPEKIFDLRRTMFMQLSVPACLIDAKQIAVMEYAVQYSGTKVILVLANSNSRIIGAACDNVQTGSFSNITSQLARAMKTTGEFADRSSVNKDYVNNIAQNQAGLSINQILAQSPQIKMLADSGKVILKSAFFDASKGAVTFPEQNNALNSLTKN